MHRHDRRPSIRRGMMWGAVFVTLLVVIGAPAAARWSDEDLYNAGRAAYLAEDYVTALQYLYAYWDRDPNYLDEHPTFAQSLDNALAYCRAFLTHTQSKCPIVGGAAAPALEPGEAVYSAPLADWPALVTIAGSVGPQTGGYGMEAYGSDPVDLGSLMPMTPLDGDFILDLVFTVEQVADSTISLILSSNGASASRFVFTLGLPEREDPSYSIREERVEGGRVVEVLRILADHAPLDWRAVSPTWPATVTMTVTREGALLRLLVNGGEIHVFPSPPVLLNLLGLEVSGTTKFLVTSIEARCPED